MKNLAILSCAVLLPLAAHAAAPTPETVKLAGEQTFSQRAVNPQIESFIHLPSVGDILKAPTAIKPVRLADAGPVVGQFSLADQLDKHRGLLTMKLGPTTWDASVAGDPSFKNYFVTFSAPNRLVIAPLGDVSRLRNEGIDVNIEPGVSYHLHFALGFPDVMKDSTMEVHPNPGTNGDPYDPSIGTILDAIKGTSYVFSVGGNEYWLLYGTDVDPKTNTLAKTRSFLFFHFDGTNSKGWPLNDAAVPVGQSTSMTLGDQTIVLEHTAAGQIIIHSN